MERWEKEEEILSEMRQRRCNGEGSFGRLVMEESGAVFKGDGDGSIR
jgi:hypothetical protein